jgi:hypothetical protein
MLTRMILPHLTTVGVRHVPFLRAFSSLPHSALPGASHHGRHDHQPSVPLPSPPIGVTRNGVLIARAATGGETPVFA